MKKKQGGTGANQHEQTGQNVHSANTAAKLAKEHGVSERTVKRAGEFAEVVEAQGLGFVDNVEQQGYDPTDELIATEPEGFERFVNGADEEDDSGESYWPPEVSGDFVGSNPPGRREAESGAGFSLEPQTKE